MARRLRLVARVLVAGDRDSLAWVATTDLEDAKENASVSRRRPVRKARFPECLRGSRMVRHRLWVASSWSE
jgi:hypothetical protein